jgi:hypothetical protein
MVIYNPQLENHKKLMNVFTNEEVKKLLNWIKSRLKIKTLCIIARGFK